MEYSLYMHVYIYIYIHQALNFSSTVQSGGSKLDPRHADGCAQQRGCRGAKLAFTANAQNISIQTGGNFIEFFVTYVAVSQCFSVTWLHFFCEQASNKEAAQEAAWNLVLSHNMLLSTRRTQRR